MRDDLHLIVLMLPSPSCNTVALFLNQPLSVRINYNATIYQSRDFEFFILRIFLSLGENKVMLLFFTETENKQEQLQTFVPPVTYIFVLFFENSGSKATDWENK